MRKFFTLVLASVLATGAVQVANADNFTVIVDASQFITVEGIRAADGSATTIRTDINGNEYRANRMDPNFPGASAPNYYRLSVVVQDQDMDNRLMQVAVCLFDSDVISSPDETNCGNGFDNPDTYSTATTDRDYRPSFRIPGDNPPTQSDATTGVYAPESLIQMAFIPGLFEQISDSGVTDNSINIVTPKYSGTNPTQHTVGPTTAFGRNAGSNPQFSAAQGTDTKTGNGIDGPYKWEIQFHFAPLFVAHNSDKWNIRVVAEYSDGTLVELIADQEHQMNYVGAFTEYSEEGFPETAAARGVVDYGEVSAGGVAEVEEISTGSYLTNSVSDITLSANRFQQSGTVVDFSNTSTPAEDNVSVGCRPTSSTDALSFFTNPTGGANSTSDFVLLPNVAANSQPAEGVDPRDPLTADTHDCALTAGPAVPTGEYSNQVTVGIGQASG